MRLKLGRLWAFRPRLLTVALLMVIGVMIGLSNLTDEVDESRVRFRLVDARPIDDPRTREVAPWNVSYGWPLLWRQYICLPTPVSVELFGGCCIPGRLALNLAMWLIMLAAPGAACEWLLRRHRPRFRWSLRAMLAGIGLAAALCGWFVAARERANFQDAVIAAKRSRVWVERWGPKWLDWLGADRYRRRIVGAKLDLFLDITDEPEVDESVLKRKDLLAALARLSGLRYLFIDVNGLDRDVADALSRLRQLRAMSIHDYGYSREEKRISQDCLAAIGDMPELEHLSLRGMPIASESLACLAGLANLKSLRLQVHHDAEGVASDAPLLSRLPPLPRLEAVDLEDCFVGDRGLRYLSVLPRLKTLSLNGTYMAEWDLADLPGLKFDAGLTDLASLELLEEVAVGRDMSSTTGLESLLALKRLKKLHALEPYLGRHPEGALTLDDGEVLCVLQVESDRCRRALDALRQANPGIVIDGDDQALEWLDELFVPQKYETIPERGFRPSANYFLNDLKQRMPWNKSLWPQPDSGD